MENAEQFWSQVEKTETCWLWLGRREKRRAALFEFKGTSTGAARVACLLSGVPAPEGKKAYLSCKNSLCVNPEHVKFGKQRGSTLVKIKKPRNTDNNADIWFWSNVSWAYSGCWLWQRFKDINGYGVAQFNGRHWKTHRISYFLQKGDIPDNLCVLHTCDTPACVNPEHLWLGTMKQNTHDMLKKERDGHTAHIGVDNGRAKLTEAQVLEIRSLYITTATSYKKLASAFGVSPNMIQFIIKRQSWKHI
jgi:hypothetical protein